MISLEQARKIRAVMEQSATTLDDAAALDVVPMFAKWSPTATYETGDRVRYHGTLYRCLQSHTAQETWTPTDAPSLWAQVLIPDPEVIPEWVQPDSTNPYMKGDKVTHNGQTWVSLIDNNVWEPGALGTEALWEAVE